MYAGRKSLECIQKQFSVSQPKMYFSDPKQSYHILKYTFGNWPMAFKLHVIEKLTRML